MSRPDSAARLGWWSFALGPALLATLALLAVSWFTTFMSVEKLWFWEKDISLYQALVNLWEGDEWFLLAVIFIFSMVFPALKLLAGLFIWARLDVSGRPIQRAIGLVQVLGKWSMVDVFVVALTVVAVNVTIIADVDIHLGIYLFCAAVFLSMVEMHLLERVIRRSHPKEAAAASA